MNISALTLNRIQKQFLKMRQNPPPNMYAVSKPENILDVHFIIFGLDGPYMGGVYHGILKLHQEYPYKPPQIQMLTPSGRFQTFTDICLSFTNFHPQNWTSSAWTIETMLLGFISFMLTNDFAAGTMINSIEQKVNFARKSLQYNLKNEQFQQLFSDQLEKLALTIPEIPATNLMLSQQQLINEEMKENNTQQLLMTKPTIKIADEFEIEDGFQLQRQMETNRMIKQQFKQICLIVLIILIFVLYMFLL